MEITYLRDQWRTLLDSAPVGQTTTRTRQKCSLEQWTKSSRDEILTTFQKALSDIKTPDSPDATIKALKILANRGILIEPPNNDAASWLRQNDTRQRFATATEGNLSVKDMTFNIIVPFTPIWIALEEETTLRNTEKDNDLQEGSITSARWVKPPSKREAFQRFAHALISLTSQQPPTN